MYFNVGVLGALAAGLILALRRQRGHTAWVDVFFPVVLLHIGQKQNLLWCFQLSFVLGVLLVGILLMLLVGTKGESRPRYFGIAVCTFLLPLCGANTLAFVPPLVLWLGWQGVREWHRGGRWLLAVACCVSLLTAYYFIGLPGPSVALSANPFDRVATAGQFLSMAFGPSLRSVWPVSTTAFILVCVATAIYLTAVKLRRRNETLGERTGAAAIGLLALIAGQVILASAVGWGRADSARPGGLAGRYATLASPLLYMLYCAWEYCWPRYWCRFGQGVLAIIMIGLLIPNSYIGVTTGRESARVMQEVEGDAHRGATPAEVTAKYGKELWADSKKAELARLLAVLQQERIGPYRDLKDER